MVPKVTRYVKHRLRIYIKKKEDKLVTIRDRRNKNVTLFIQGFPRTARFPRTTSM